VTGAAAVRAQAAAVKALGGGTAGAVTTDYRGNGYEVTVKKTDGISTVVHLTSGLQVMTGPPGGPARACETGQAMDLPRGHVGILTCAEQPPCALISPRVLA
jgi:hypothetical protein